MFLFVNLCVLFEYRTNNNNNNNFIVCRVLHVREEKNVCAECSQSGKMDNGYMYIIYVSYVHCSLHDRVDQFWLYATI